MSTVTEHRHLWSSDGHCQHCGLNANVLEERVRELEDLIVHGNEEITVTECCGRGAEHNEARAILARKEEK